MLHWELLHKKNMYDMLVQNIKLIHWWLIFEIEPHFLSFIYLFVHLFIYLLICLFTYLFILFCFILFLLTFFFLIKNASSVFYPCFYLLVFFIDGFVIYFFSLRLDLNDILLFSFNLFYSTLIGSITECELK